LGEKTKLSAPHFQKWKIIIDWSNLFPFTVVHSVLNWDLDSYWIILQIHRAVSKILIYTLMMLVTYTQEIPVLEPMVIVAPRNVAFYPFPDVFGHQEKQSRHPSDTVGVPNINTPHISTKESGEHSPIIEGKQAPHAVVGIKKQNKTIGSKRGLWSDNEHTLFMKGYEKHGRNWALIAKEYVPCIISCIGLSLLVRDNKSEATLRNFSRGEVMTIAGMTL
jgi:hypothetical protein